MWLDSVHIFLMHNFQIHFVIMKTRSANPGHTDSVIKTFWNVINGRKFNCSSSYILFPDLFHWLGLVWVILRYVYVMSTLIQLNKTRSVDWNSWCLEPPSTLFAVQDLFFRQLLVWSPSTAHCISIAMLSKNAVFGSNLQIPRKSWITSGAHLEQSS